MGQNGPKNTNNSIYGHWAYEFWLIGLKFLTKTFFWRENGRGQRVWGLQSRQKSWTTGWNFLVSRYPSPTPLKA